MTLKELRDRYAGLCDDLLDYAEALQREADRLRAWANESADRAWEMQRERDRESLRANKRATVIGYIYSILLNFESGDADDPVDRCLNTIRNWDVLQEGGQDEPD